MDKYKYEGVHCSDGDNDVKSSRGPFFKQLLICCAVWTCFFMSGMCLGAPTVIVPQLRREANSTDAVSDEMASWLSTAYGIGVIPFNIILPVSARFFGRKPTYIFILVDGIVGFISFYYSTNVTQLLISLISLGPLHSGATTLLLLITNEYPSPRYRGSFLTAQTASFAWGIWASNAIGTFFHWKYISLLGMTCSTLTLVIVSLCPDSPYWLAGTGNLDQCVSSHRWLRGTDRESERELAELLSTARDRNVKKNRLTKAYTTKYLSGCKSKEFYKPILLGFLTFVLYSYTGKVVCMVYAIDIIKKITDSESTAYIGMLILDGITVLGMYMGCVFARYLKRRTLLFICSSIGITLLLILSLYLYLINLSLITENVYVSITLLLIFSMAISCGPMILAPTVRGEILPMKNRSLALIIIGSAADFAMAIVIKISPYLFRAFDLHGTFLFFGIVTSVCVSLLYKYLPETKDRTLQDIAAAMRGHHLIEQVEDT